MHDRLQRMVTEAAPAPQPTDRATAEAWLAWACEHDHQESCQCHGCLRAWWLVRTAPDPGAVEAIEHMALEVGLSPALAIAAAVALAPDPYEAET